MRLAALRVVFLLVAGALAALPALSGASLPAQAPNRWPPDSLRNVQVIPPSTPVIEVVGAMRNFAGALGVRCQYCHVGEEGAPLSSFDLASDARRNKLVARQMMRMVAGINRRLDTIPERPAPLLAVTCATCHRGVARPVSLATLVSEAAVASGADSALRAYRALRARNDEARGRLGDVRRDP